MSVNSLPKTATRQRRGCDLNPGPTAPESSTLTTRLPSHNRRWIYCKWRQIIGHDYFPASCAPIAADRPSCRWINYTVTLTAGTGRKCWGRQFSVGRCPGWGGKCPVTGPASAATVTPPSGVRSHYRQSSSLWRICQRCVRWHSQPTAVRYHRHVHVCGTQVHGLRLRPRLKPSFCAIPSHRIASFSSSGLTPRIPRTV